MSSLFLLLQKLSPTSSTGPASTSTGAALAPVEGAPRHSILIDPEKQQLIHKYPSRPAAAAAGSSSCIEPLRLQLPAPINCSFAIRLHPDHSSLVDECNEWGLSFCYPASSLPEAVREAFIGGLFPLLPAVAYPSSSVSKRRLLLCIKLTIWYFWLDDSIDEADAHTAAGIVESYITVLLSPRNAGSVQYKTRNERIIEFTERFRVEIWDEIREEMTPDLERRYVNECVRSITAMKEMWAVRETSAGGFESADGSAAVRSRQKLDSVLALRLLDGFCWTFTTLLEYALGIELPDPEGKTEFAKSSKTDAYSLAGAMLDGQRRRPVGGDDESINSEAMQEVPREIWGMIQEEERTAVALIRQIRSIARQAQGAHLTCVMYAEALCDFMSGHLYWTTGGITVLTMSLGTPLPLMWSSTPSPLSTSSACSAKPN
ncbi:hypothetical protein L7F22_049232 [Adiantum nelumboides]|nr:hypothetical protein [Adiantum nelumboides]